MASISSGYHKVSSPADFGALHLRIHEGGVDGVDLNIRPGANDMATWPNARCTFASSELTALTCVEHDLPPAGGTLEREETEPRAEVEGIHSESRSLKLRSGVGGRAGTCSLDVDMRYVMVRREAPVSEGHRSRSYDGRKSK